MGKQHLPAVLSGGHIGLIKFYLLSACSRSVFIEIRSTPNVVANSLPHPCAVVCVVLIGCITHWENQPPGRSCRAEIVQQCVYQESSSPPLGSCFPGILWPVWISSKRQLLLPLAKHTPYVGVQTHLGCLKFVFFLLLRIGLPLQGAFTLSCCWCFSPLGD